MSRIITVASGKGGVGKTNISVNTAFYLASQGYRTCLFDADMGLANVDILLGLYPDYTLEDVMTGEKDINDILISVSNGLDIIPGGSGVKMLADPEPDRVDSIIKALSGLEDYDYFIFDCSAGISKSVISFCMASPEIVLVVTPEPTSLTDAYALLKMLRLNKFDGSVMIAINQCMNIEVANRLYTKFKEVVQKHLKMDIFPLGTIPLDAYVSKAVKEQKPLVSLYPNSGAAKGIKNLARYLITIGSTNITEYELGDFWYKLFETAKTDLKVPQREKKREEEPRKLPVEQRRILRKSEEPAEVTGPIDAEIPVDDSCNLPAMERQMNSVDLYAILEGLVKGIEGISSELGTIRKIMEKDQKRYSKNDPDKMDSVI